MIKIPKNLTTLEWLEFKGCKSKRDFTEKKYAKQFCKNAKKQSNLNIKPYKCKYCKNYHVTKK